MTDINLENLKELRRKVAERQKERLKPEDRVDYILSSKNAKEIIKGLITDKYCFSDINEMVYLITQENSLSDKEKLERISNLTEIYADE